MFLDFNGLIHPCVNNVLIQNKSKIYLKKNSNYYFLKKLKIIYLHLLKQVSLVYISIDGVAPRAKMIQQRKRRFRSIQQKKITDDIYKKHNVEIKTKWDTNAITPGTQFIINYQFSYIK